jgi:hypothetical protein
MPVALSPRMLDPIWPCPCRIPPAPSEHAIYTGPATTADSQPRQARTNPGAPTREIRHRPHPAVCASFPFRRGSRPSQATHADRWRRGFCPAADCRRPPDRAVPAGLRYRAAPAM